MPKPIPRDFYERDTIDVARELLGQRLVHQLPSGQRLSGRIVETEAYLGVEDPAAHSYAGRRTSRTEVMFGEAGLSYVYFIYGMYFCFNVVTMARDVPEAVLVRALEIEEGLAHMLSTRSLPTAAAHRIAAGPGKLCQALQIGRELNGVDLTRGSELWLEEVGAVRDVDLIEGPRIGIGSQHDACHWPLRFGIRGHASLSPAKF